MRDLSLLSAAALMPPLRRYLQMRVTLDSLAVDDVDLGTGHLRVTYCILPRDGDAGAGQQYTHFAYTMRTCNVQ